MASITFQGLHNISAQSFTVPIPNSNYIIITRDKIKECAYEQLKGTNAYRDILPYLNTMCFSKIAPINLNPIDAETGEPSDRYTEIDYGNMYCINKNANWEGLCSASSRTDTTGAKIVRNLHIKPLKETVNGEVIKYTPTRATGGSLSLREYYGDIIIGTQESPTNGGIILLFIDGAPILKAVGEFQAYGISEFKLCCSTNNKNAIRATWFNVIDIRNVDTTNCKVFALLNHYSTPCTIIFGNFSNENWCSVLSNGTNTSNDVFMNDAPTRGRIAVMTTETPPVLKNCRCDLYGNPIYYDNLGNVTDSTNGLLIYSNSCDWVDIGKFERIMVPKTPDHSCLEAYKNNTYKGYEGTGWSVHADKIFEYDPEKEYLVKKEGGENGKPVWIYRAEHKR